VVTAVPLLSLLLLESTVSVYATGGAFYYTGRELGEAHKDLYITSEEFDEVGAEIGRALDYFNVPEPEKQEVFGAIVARKAEVINPSR
jgi:hemoglobin